LTAHELVVAGIAMRRLRTKAARAALERAEHSARHAGIPALKAEVDSALLILNTPAARLIAGGEERLLLLEEVEESAAESSGEDGFDPDEDPLLADAIQLVAEMQTASTSMLQRRLRLGYTRAGRLIDMLERRGVISGYEGSKPRQVLISEGDVPRVLAALGEQPIPVLDDDPPE